MKSTRPEPLPEATGGTEAFRRESERLGVSANAAPGRLVSFLPPHERNLRRPRRVVVKTRTGSFAMAVPYELGRQLRTVDDDSPDLVDNLAKCFAFARCVGYEAVRADLIAGLGADVYAVLAGRA